mgnify:CR=1 FL=1
MNNKVYFPTLKDGSKTKGFNNTYKRQFWDKPAFTITMYTSRIVRSRMDTQDILLLTLKTKKRESGLILAP